MQRIYRAHCTTYSITCASIRNGQTVRAKFSLVKVSGVSRMSSRLRTIEQLLKSPAPFGFEGFRVDEIESGAGVEHGR